jgi:hypothetical protein
VRPCTPCPQELQLGQVICEYFGPRLPTEELQQGLSSYALAVSSSRRKAHQKTFIDGNYEHVPYDGPRSPAIYVNHSTRPNAKVQHWPTPTAYGTSSDSTELQDRMWLVSTESIPGAPSLINLEISALPTIRCLPLSPPVSGPSLVFGGVLHFPSLPWQAVVRSALTTSRVEAATGTRHLRRRNGARYEWQCLRRAGMSLSCMVSRPLV